MLKRWGIFYGWIVVIAVATLAFGGTGARFSFAAFFKPMTEQFGWDRTALAGAASLNLLLSGVLRPFGGWLVDRYGAKFLAIWGVLVSGIVMALFSFVTELWQAYALFLVLSIGYVAGPVATVKMVGAWFVRRRALALSVGSTGTALGELVVTPLAMWMLVIGGWQASFRMLAVMLFVVILPVGIILLKNSPKEKGTYPDGDPASEGSGSVATVAGRIVAAGQSEHNATLGEALRSSTFWKLGVGFFVCGFTMSFANTHFLAFADDMHFEPMVAATALGLVGGFSILGTLSLGFLSDLVGRKNVLGVVYLLRGLSFLILLGVDSPVTLYLASFVLGISWTATTPLTSAMSADLWGMASIGVIFGSLFTIMPIGSALGATLDAYIFDTHHNYQLALWFNVFAGLVAGLAVLSIKEKALTVKKKVAAAVGVGASEDAGR